MQKQMACSPTARVRLAITLALAVIFPLLTGCHIVHKPVEIEKLLTPLSDADTPQLIRVVNQAARVRSLHGKVDIQFEDTSFATSGIAEKYRAADGTITLQRPAKVYLVVQGPLAIGDVAQMTSDGEHFRIAVLKGDEKYKTFVRGTNAAVYSKLDTNGNSNPKNKSNEKDKATSEAQAVSALSNLRPQHLTDALLVRPIDPEAAGVIYSQSEFFESEKDPAKVDSTKRVVRGYYFLEELQTVSNGAARLLRRFWFDRVGGIRLARLQTFDEKGVLVTDVTYGELKRFGPGGELLLPYSVGLTRPQDHYKITITYQAPETVTLDHEYEPEVFVLENRFGLREVDLDADKRPATPKN
jgi:hypothetical protein